MQHCISIFIMGKRRNKRESRDYDIKLPNVNLGVSRYAEIPSKGTFSGVDGPEATRGYIMRCCLDDRSQGLRIIYLLKIRYNDLSRFATPMDDSQVQTREITPNSEPLRPQEQTQERLFAANPYII